jgi:alpha-galactosidase
MIERAMGALTRRTVLGAALASVPGVAQARRMSFGGGSRSITRMVAPVPYMGWNTYYGLGVNYTETQIRSVADFLVSSGLAAVGYNIVWLDGGWTQGTSNRDGNGNLVAVSASFPSGMAALASYIHSKSLYAGLYTDGGTTGCVTQGGSEGHYAQDMALFFNSWQYDAVKVDSCGIHTESLDPQTVFTSVANAIVTATGAMQLLNVCNPFSPYNSWSWAPGIGATSWRTQYDIASGPGGATWAYVMTNFDGNSAQPAVNVAGHYNDPDYLQVEQGGLTTTEWQSQFLLWAVMGSPLIIGTDPRSFAAGSLTLLKNPEILAINRDIACNQATNVSGSTPAGTQVWRKLLNDGTRAVALLNRNATASNVSFVNTDVGLSGSFNARDVVAGSNLGSFTSYTVANLASHAVQLLKLT